MTNIADTIASDKADIAIAAAAAKAAALGVAASIAVLDAGAHLKAVTRMDGAVLGSIDVSIGKARTSVHFGISSADVWAYCQPGAPAPNLQASNGGLMPFAGGLPILSDSRLAGAIGVSGGTPAQDLEIAEAAIAALVG